MYVIMWLEKKNWTEFEKTIKKQYRYFLN